MTTQKKERKQVRRKDSRGRVLEANEYQRSDGRYEFRYTDPGNPKVFTVYSWRLIESDPVPAGKKKTPALRTIEREIQRQQLNGIRYYDKKTTTLNDLFLIWKETKINAVKITTYQTYLQTYAWYIDKTLGFRTLDFFNSMVITKFYLYLLNERKLKSGTILIVHNILTQIFNVADESLFSVNPCIKAYRTFSNNTKKMRKSVEVDTYLTQEEESAYLDFISKYGNSKQYQFMCIVALNTGMRVGELCGLQWQDCDFEKNVIHIRHNLVRIIDENSNKLTYIISTPKSDAGNRDIPMLEIVKGILIDMKEETRKESGFVFLNRTGNFVKPVHFNDYLNRSVQAYNKLYEENPDDMVGPLPHIYPHMLRHTFSTKMYRAGVDPKIMQIIMGHSSISMTLDVYTDLSKDQNRINQEVAKLN